MATATEEQAPKAIMDNWMSGIETLTAPEPPKPAPKKEEKPDGKTDAAERPSAPAPADKPPVGDTANPPKPGPAPDAAGSVPPGGADTKPAPDAKAGDTPKAGEKEDWEKAAAPKGAKEWDKWKEGRRTAETALKAQIKEKETKLTELQSQLSELEKKASAALEPTPELKAQLERLTKENSELTDKITALNVTEHPKFKAYFQGKIDSAIGKAKKLVGTDNAETIERIIKLPEGDYKTAQLEEFMGGIDSELTKSRLAVVLEEMDNIQTEREQEIAKANQHRDKLNGDQTAALTKLNAEREAVYNQTVALMTDGQKGLAPFQMKEGDDAWNQTVQKRLQAVEGLLKNPDIKPDVLAKAAFFAVALPAVMQSWQAEAKSWAKEKEAYEKQIASLTAAEPRGGATTESKDESGTLKITKDMKPGEIAKRFARSAVEMVNR